MRTFFFHKQTCLFGEHQETQSSGICVLGTSSGASFVSCERNPFLLNIPYGQMFTNLHMVLLSLKKTNWPITLIYELGCFYQIQKWQISRNVIFCQLMNIFGYSFIFGTEYSITEAWDWWIDSFHLYSWSYKALLSCNTRSCREACSSMTCLYGFCMTSLCLLLINTNTRNRTAILYSSNTPSTPYIQTMQQLTHFLRTHKRKF